MKDDKLAQVVRVIVRKLLKQREDVYGAPCSVKACPMRSSGCGAATNVVPIKKQAN